MAEQMAEPTAAPTARESPVGYGDGPVGVVLCGGASTRMGAVKATLPTPSGPLAGIPARALAAAGCGSVVAVGGDASVMEPLARTLGIGWIPDEWPGQGPLGGVATACARLTGQTLLVCACDLPWIDRAAVVPLLDAVCEPSPYDAAVYELDGVAQWSVMALSVRAAAGLAAAFAAGERSLHGGIAATGLAVAHLTPPEPHAIRDADSPEDLPAPWRP